MFVAYDFLDINRRAPGVEVIVARLNDLLPVHYPDDNNVSGRQSLLLSQFLFVAQDAKATQEQDYGGERSD